MELLDIDDLPFHQAPTPFNVPAVSDVHFNDGYYCSAYAEGWYLSIGLRIHPNMNVIDGFTCLARNGEQRALRVSRVLRPNYTELVVGSLRMAVLEPMRRVRFELSESPIGVSYELEFEAVASPFFEAPYRHRRYGHLVNDLVRYTQVCRANGSLVCDGQTTTVSRWHALRDHSWGIRANMGPRTNHGGVALAESEVDRRRFRLWVPFEVEGYSGFFNTHEDEDGRPLDFEGALTFRDGKIVKLTGVRHELEYSPGTRNVVGGVLALRDENDTWRDYRLTLADTPADVQGCGYYGGWHDSGSPGVYRGRGPVVEFDRYPSGGAFGATGPTHIPDGKRLGPTEFPCFLRGPGGEEGMAHLEHAVLGPYRPYAFV